MRIVRALKWLAGCIFLGLGSRAGVAQRAWNRGLASDFATHRGWVKSIANNGNLNWREKPPGTPVYPFNAGL